jgi:gamma-glutamyltranspeptidase/glutathione hydrolase
MLKMVLAWVLLADAVSVARADTAVAERGMVATVHPLATDAGVSVLRGGGNAVDAAVAAALTLGVVDGHNSGIGGGCFILIRRKDGKIVAIDGRETAPAKATRDMYVRDGQAKTELSQVGPLASGVPGALAAYHRAVSDHGRNQFKQLLLPAANIAELGFPIDRVYAEALEKTASTIRQFEASRAVLLNPDGSPYQAGDILKQPDLSRTYRAIAEQGTDWFYRGPFAKAAGKWMAANGGLLTAQDFAAYQTVLRDPITSRYRGYTIVGFPPPSSGGAHVAQILNIAERFDLKQLHEQDPAIMVHVVAEAMKLAFADRAYWLGDPDFASVPRGLTDESYAGQLAQRIDLDTATRVERYATPPGAQSDLFGKHTTHVAAADAEGNWVAITATINTTFGSKVIIPGTGVIMNNEMDDFSVQPGVPNAFGLVGAQANAIEPGKRPLSSMSPTIVLKDGQPVMTLGAAGGPTIISQVVLALIQRIDLGMSVPESLAVPRFHHQWSPDRIMVEQSFDQRLLSGLRERGHVVEVAGPIGVTQAIAITDDGKSLMGVTDSRVSGKAAGY